MLVGYARSSTLEQEAGLEAQLRELKALRCERVFSEQTSSIGPRPVLEQALDFTRAGDVLVVTKLDCLARSVTHSGSILERLERKGGRLEDRQPRSGYRNAYGSAGGQCASRRSPVRARDDA